jgi:hypothetical protein
MILKNHCCGARKNSGRYICTSTRMQNTVEISKKQPGGAERPKGHSPSGPNTGAKPTP